MQNERRSATILHLGLLIVTFVFSFYDTLKTSKASLETPSLGVFLYRCLLIVSMIPTLFSQYIYFVVAQPNTYISEIYYKFILEYMPFTVFIAIYLYCDAPNRALVKLV